MADRDDSTKLSTNQARAGSTPHMTRYILGISMVLIVIVMAVILLW